MDHRHLRYFIVVAEELNFTRAAERLNTVQPSLSQQIRHLEEMVGTPLFYRDKHHVSLTEAGRIFLSEARNILSSTERAIALACRAARGEAGHINIGFVPGAEGKVFSHLLPFLREKVPDIELSLRSMTSPEQLVALASSEVDVGFLRGPVDNPEIVSEVIVRDTIVAVIPTNHPLAKSKRLSIQALAAIPLIQVSIKKAPAIHEIANRLAARAGVQFKTLLDTDGIMATLNAVGAGLGFSIVPEYVRQIAPPTVAVRALDVNPVPEIELLVAHRKDNRLPALIFFLNFLHECMGPKPKSRG